MKTIPTTSRHLRFQFPVLMETWTWRATLFGPEIDPAALPCVAQWLETDPQREFTELPASDCICLQKETIPPSMKSSGTVHPYRIAIRSGPHDSWPSSGP